MKGLATGFRVNVQIGLGGKFLLAERACEVLTGVNLGVMLLQQLEVFEIFCLKGLRYVIFTLHHRTEEPRVHHGRIRLLE